MAVKFANLERLSKQLSEQVDAKTSYTYKDLHLDFALLAEDAGTKAQLTAKNNDVVVDYDAAAIKNSLKNLFNTRPGQRFLFPLYGLDLHQFLFEPITEPNAQLIGEAIEQTIKKYEQRVTLVNCNVIASPDENQYDITIVVEMPTLGYQLPINTIMDIKNQSFIFVETSRNR